MTTFKCCQCGKEGEFSVMNTTWYQLPEGWWERQGHYDCDAPEQVCSRTCVVARETFEARIREYEERVREEYGNTRRNDDHPDRTAKDKAYAQMVKKYGSNWRDEFKPTGWP